MNFNALLSGPLEQIKMIDFLLGSHEFLGNHSFPEFLIGYAFGAALIIGAPTVFLLLAFTSALMKTNGKMGGYKELKKQIIDYFFVWIDLYYLFFVGSGKIKGGQSFNDDSP